MSVKKIFFFKILFILLATLSIVEYNSNKYTIRYDIKILENDTNQHAQIYYETLGSYNTQKYKDIEYYNYKKRKKRFQHVKSHIITQDKITALRLDPLNGKGLIRIKNFSISSKYDTHHVDFRNTHTLNNSQNINIKKKTKQSIKLTCTGSDPYLEITKNIDLKKYNFNYITYFILVSILLFILLYLLEMYTMEFTLFGILFFYSLNVVIGQTASYLLFIFAFISIVIFIYDKTNKQIFMKQILVFLLIYLSMSYLTVLFSRPLADLNYLNSKSILIILACLIPIGFYKIPNFNYTFFKNSLTALLIAFALFIIMLNLKFITPDQIIPYDLMSIRRNNWVQKNYMFWYILLMFGTLSFYHLKNKKDMIIIFLVILISYYALFNGYSRSARLAFIVGLIFYFLLSMINVKRKYLLIFIWIMTLYIIFSPLLFSLIDLTPYHHRLVHRDALYHTAAALIKEHWLLGYGFGSTLQMNIHDFVSVSELPKHYVSTFRGGHPHNLSLLFWLEFGIFGALFLAYYIHKMLLFFINETHGKINQPALFGMIVAFDIITSFSWSIWYYQVLLTFSFFGVMLILSTNINILTHQGKQ